MIMGQICLYAAANQHHKFLSLSTRDPIGDQWGSGVRADSSGALTKRRNAGVCFQTHPLLKTGVIVVLHQSAKPWAAHFDHPGPARAGDGQWSWGVMEISHDFKSLGTPAANKATK